MPTISFTGTDLATLQASDANVTKIGSGTDILINSNTGYASANGSFSGYYHSTAPAGADQKVVADFQVANAAHTGPGVCLRMDTAGNNLYWANFNGTSGWVIRKRVGGTFSLVASYVGDTPTSLTSVEFSVVGTTLNLYINGVLRIDTIDSSLSTANQWGVGTFFADANNSRLIDNAVFSDVVSGNAGSASGTSTNTATGASSASGSASGTGTSTNTATGSTLASGAGSSAGTSTATAVGISAASGVGNGSGTSTAEAVGEEAAGDSNAGLSEGTSTAFAVGASIVSGAGSSAGTSTAVADASTTTSDRSTSPWGRRAALRKRLKSIFVREQKAPEINHDILMALAETIAKNLQEEWDEAA